MTISEEDKKSVEEEKKKSFKKHYMWNTKGKRYLAKTYKQHLKGVKLGHTHKKPKKKKTNTISTIARLLPNNLWRGSCCTM